MFCVALRRRCAALRRNDLTYTYGQEHRELDTRRARRLLKEHIALCMFLEHQHKASKSKYINKSIE